MFYVSPHDGYEFVVWECKELFYTRLELDTLRHFCRHQVYGSRKDACMLANTSMQISTRRLILIAALWCRTMHVNIESMI